MEKKDEILVEVSGLSKKFSRSLKRSMLYGLQDVMGSMIGLDADGSRLRKDEFWAVKDVNFTLRRGECLGLIGRNGAGKSTLLKMLNGLIRPDQGSIVMRGKVGALIELGAGFNPLLTGRENIYINGQLLGFTKAEIDHKMQAILDFAEINEFIDSPVQNYSSGMKVRLGFAVAAQMEPDVLIIDEVLAVGDLGFVLKCFNAIDSLLDKAAVIFVSHNMPQVSRICSGIIMLEKGRMIFHENDISRGIDLYYSKFADENKKNVVFERSDTAGLIDIQACNTRGECSAEKVEIRHLEDLIFHVELKVHDTIREPNVVFTVHDKEQRPIGVCMRKEGLGRTNIVKEEDGFVFYKLKLVLPRINLSKGIYSVSLSVMEKFRSLPLLRLQSAIMFQVLSDEDVWPPIEFEGVWS
jgi:lipopolysaccharide transport system ATP-binding protein